MIPLDLLKISFIIFSVLISISDIKTGAVPRLAFVLTFPLFIMLKIKDNAPVNLYEPIIGFLAGLIIFILAYFLSRKRLGLADVWYSALMGLVLGLRYWYAAIAVACIIGIVFMLISRRRKIPFIPFMAFGSTLTLTIQIFFKF